MFSSCRETVLFGCSLNLISSSNAEESLSFVINAVFSLLDKLLLFKRSTITLFISVTSCFISKSTLYKISRSEKLSLSLWPSITIGRFLLESMSGRYLVKISSSTSLEFSITEICSATFFSCLIFPGHEYFSSISTAF